jgi:hypothetical protein
MHLRSRRFALLAFLTVGALEVTGSSALAQSDPTASVGSPLTASVRFDAGAAETPLSATERQLAASFKPKMKASYLRAIQGGAADEDSGIGVGVLGMITRTSLRGDEDEGFFDLDNKTGWGVGLWVGGNRNGRVGFVGEFIYLVRGDDEFKTKALQIPAVFHINFGSRSRNSVGGFIVVGPSFTINLKQESFGIDVSDDFNGADIGIIAGAGVEFFRITIEGRGNWGLRSISSEGDVVDAKTFTFEFLGKFAFN